MVVAAVVLDVIVLDVIVLDVIVLDVVVLDALVDVLDDINHSATRRYDLDLIANGMPQ
jgi:hypothetical protein